MAFDALINNVDRVPLLWDNDGRSDNPNAEGLGVSTVGLVRTLGWIFAGRVNCGKMMRLASCSDLAEGALGHAQDEVCGYGSKLNHQGTAGFGPYSHLPGFHFGYFF